MAESADTAFWTETCSCSKVVAPFDLFLLMLCMVLLLLTQQQTEGLLVLIVLMGFGAINSMEWWCTGVDYVFTFIFKIWSANVFQGESECIASVAMTHEFECSFLVVGGTDPALLCSCCLLVSCWTQRVSSSHKVKTNLKRRSSNTDCQVESVKEK